MNRYLRSALATTLLVLLLAGVPVLLNRLGNPLPAWTALRAGDLSDDVLVDVLTAVAWLAWVTFAWAVLLETLTTARGLPSPHLPGTVPGIGHLAHVLVVAAFMIGPALTSGHAHTPGPSGTAVTLHIATASQQLARTTTTPHADQPAAPGPATPAPAAGFMAAPPGHDPHTTPTDLKWYIVPAGTPTTMWYLAETYLGDGTRWTQIRDLNTGRIQPTDGTVMSAHPGWLAPGWIIILPADAHPYPLPTQPAPNPTTASPPGTASTTPDHRSPLPDIGAGTGAGLILGLTVRELTARRRRQWRHRRPGRTLASTPTAEPPTPASPALRQASKQPAVTEKGLTESQLEDQPVPPARGAAPWEAFSDATGALADRFTATSNADTTDQVALDSHRPDQSDSTNAQAASAESTPATAPSVLDAPTIAVLAASATTRRDLQVLAPRVPTGLRSRIQHADPTLDDDLHAWHDPTTTRPRLSVLGPLRVRAAGNLPEQRPREDWYREVLACLAAHPRGITAEQLAAALYPNDPDAATKPKLRGAVHHLRRWLGTDPATGRPYLPHAAEATSGGPARYRVEGLLVDAELFRRLRLRGTAGNPGGITDLETALTLVTGSPFDQRRQGGYAWLTDIPLDVEYLGMIIDVAHLVATHHLTHGRPDLAEHAARTSLRAGCVDDIPLLDLVAACDAQGRTGEAGSWVQRILAAHGAEVEEDLPPRTADVLHRRQWLNVS